MYIWCVCACGMYVCMCGLYVCICGMCACGMCGLCELCVCICGVCVVCVCMWYVCMYVYAVHVCMHMQDPSLNMELEHFFFWWSQPSARWSQRCPCLSPVAFPTPARTSWSHAISYLNFFETGFHYVVPAGQELTCRPGWPQTNRVPPASTSQAPGWKTPTFAWMLEDRIRVLTCV